MGALKQMWTREEETALRAGVRKYGVGKWVSILSDRKYSPALQSRSNVDLKDKWRNLDLGSRRKRAKIAFQNQDEEDYNDTALAIVEVANDGEQEILPASPPNGDNEELFTSVDTFILEAITSLNKRLGPNKKSIVLHVEENMQPGKRRLVASRLKHLVNVGTIIRKNNRYKISPTYAAAEAEQSSPQLLLEGNKENGVENHTKSQVDGEAFKINGMTEEEASAAVAKALAEAEFARVEAEEAAKEADRAEAEAEAMKDYAEAVMEVWKDSMRCQSG
ncbi:unnamed protein product [Eruca vesicaria subsp. sativa]|uniref:MYB transcription factor n=1 Tax=Eruca vesicaria subsp. sativa TaxID=29727 RepID=A0ABC8LLN1_ERUVS|nr:unnamed protein product [Eruca vesicaria subsp. sativa]